MEDRHWLLCMVVAQLLVVAGTRASSSLIPARVQARLIAKAAEWDRNQMSGPGTRILLLAARQGDPESLGHARLLAHELAAIEEIAAGPHREEVIVVDGAAQAIQLIGARGASIVYLSSGLESSVAAIAEGLSGTTVLTVGGVAGYAEKGVVLGFEAVSGRVELVVNLPQSKKQNVDFRAAFLSLVRVIR